MKKSLIFALALFCFSLPALAGTASLSDSTMQCLDCHMDIHPGIYEDWLSSRHAITTPEAAGKAKGLGRKVSSENVPSSLAQNAVGCAECHTANPGNHADSFYHNGFEVHTVVTPENCAICHVEERSQFSENIMAHAYGNLMNNPVYGLLINATIGKPQVTEKGLVFGEPDSATLEQSCLYCHGTKLLVTGTKTRDTILGEMEFAQIEGWPNQGVGRINPDNSMGSCSACHPRHSFSMAAARKPSTCKQCHIGPDVPSFKVYDASKHGNIYSAQGSKWNFDATPWVIGEHFTAPTCAACHMSLLADGSGQKVVERTHRMNDRLSHRLFGVIYAHPHPQSPDVSTLKNSDGLPLPVDFAGNFAKEGLIDQKEQQKRTQKMKASCMNCHSGTWVEKHFENLAHAIKETNRATLAATQLMQQAWDKGLCQGVAQGANPFDEGLERMWTLTWLFYANSARLAAAMAGGGDYGTFANGRYQLSQTLSEMQDRIKMLEGTQGASTRKKR
jgi:hypothetical protein